MSSIDVPLLPSFQGPLDHRSHGNATFRDSSVVQAYKYEGMQFYLTETDGTREPGLYILKTVGANATTDVWAKFEEAAPESGALPYLPAFAVTTPLSSTANIHADNNTGVYSSGAGLPIAKINASTTFVDIDVNAHGDHLLSTRSFYLPPRTDGATVTSVAQDIFRSIDGHYVPLDPTMFEIGTTPQTLNIRLPSDATDDATATNNFVAYDYTVITFDDHPGTRTGGKLRFIYFSI